MYRTACHCVDQTGDYLPVPKCLELLNVLAEPSSKFGTTATDTEGRLSTWHNCNTHLAAKQAYTGGTLMYNATRVLYRQYIYTVHK